MDVTREDLEAAASQGLLSSEQAAALWSALEEKSSQKPRFDAQHVMYYFGALIVISAMGWFMNTGWEQFGGGGLFAISCAYAVCFVLAGRTLWHKEKLRVPGGLLITIAVCMAPLAIYGLERLVGYWPQGNPGNYQGYHVWVNGSWLLMEVGTIAAGALALHFFRFPFLTAPIAFSLWYMSMDLTPMFFGRDTFTWEERLIVSALFGLVVLLFSYLVDRRTKADYAFWGYLFGTMAFWGGLSFMESDSEPNKALYCLINLLLMALSVLLQRRVFIIFGALGVCGYLGHLAHSVFKDSLIFPFALTLIGILVIYGGITYQRNRQAFEARVLSRMPPSLKRLLPSQRGHARSARG
jgi:hypothetical protein